MCYTCRLFALLLLLIPILAIRQQKDTLTRKLDSLAKNPDSTGAKQKNVVSPSFYNENTRITPRVYITLMVDDIKQQWTYSFRATGKDWLEVGGFAAVTTGAILFADKPVNRFTVEQVRTNKSVVSASLYVTNFGGLYEAYTLAALGSLWLDLPPGQGKNDHAACNAGLYNGSGYRDCAQISDQPATPILL